MVYGIGRIDSSGRVADRAVIAALAELMSADLSALDLVAFMAGGVHFGEHTCVVALGIGIDGVKHPLGVEEGPTENAAVVTDLITAAVHVIEDLAGQASATQPKAQA